MLAMIAVYLRIFCLVRKSIRRDLEQMMGREEQSLLRMQNQMSEAIRKREKEVAFSVFLFVGVFLLCWAPGILMSNAIYIISSGDIKKEPKTLRVVADWVQLIGFGLNSLLNPLIYVFRYAKFRKAAVAVSRV